jgi:hypothetical protein
MSDFWAMSLWEFAAAVDGWNRAQGGDATPGMSVERYDELLQKHGYR